MNFTREPLIETVISPKEGYKLVLRNSKVGGQEEYFVDAVEVISFGKATFYRSLEKPKGFLLPVADYEILETRETRMVLKTPGSEKGIKIAGGREAPLKVKEETPTEETTQEPRGDKRRERGRRSRKRRGKGDYEEEAPEGAAEAPIAEKGEERKPEERRAERPSLIPPPSTLISETIVRYKTASPPEEPAPEKPSQAHVPHTHISRENEDEDGGGEEVPF